MLNIIKINQILYLPFKFRINKYLTFFNQHFVLFIKNRHNNCFGTGYRHIFQFVLKILCEQIAKNQRFIGLVALFLRKSELIKELKGCFYNSVRLQKDENVLCRGDEVYYIQSRLFLRDKLAVGVYYLSLTIIIIIKLIAITFRLIQSIIFRRSNQPKSFNQILYFFHNFCLFLRIAHRHKLIILFFQSFL